MVLKKVFWSSKQASVPLTVVTGLNQNRLHQLESQCRSYHGPLSAAVYVVLYNPDKRLQLTDQQEAELNITVSAVAKLHARYVHLSMNKEY
jgi:hypothetical protein